MTSLKSICAMTAAALAFGAVVHAGPVLQGPVLNGPVLQGPVLNGPVLQGPVLNTSLPQALKLQPVSIPRIATGRPVAVALPSGETIAVR